MMTVSSEAASLLKLNFISHKLQLVHEFLCVCPNVRPSKSSLNIFSRGPSRGLFCKCENDLGFSVCAGAHMSWDWLAEHMPVFATVMENPSWQIWARAVSRRESWGRSPEIFSNPNPCNLSPGPGITSWTVSRHVSSSYSPSQWNNRREEAVATRGALTLISVSLARDHGRQTVLRRLSSLIFKLWLHPFWFAAVTNWGILESNPAVSDASL